MPRICSAGKPSVPWNTTPFAPDDACSDKMRGTCHRSPFGTMYAPSTDTNGAALLTSFRAAFPAKHIPQQPAAGIARTTFGRKCGGSWQMSLPGTFLPRTLRQGQSTQHAKTLRRWVTKPELLPLERRTWVATTYGPEVGFLHTPTTKANYCAASMQKWPCARAFRTVFGKATPAAHEWLMGWPIGWSDCAPLETGKFQLWHGRSCQQCRCHRGMPRRHPVRRLASPGCGSARLQARKDPNLPGVAQRRSHESAPIHPPVDRRHGSPRG